MRMPPCSFVLAITFWIAGLIAPGTRAEAETDVVFADFESDDYGQWRTSGSAFGSGPARGTLPGQMPVGGFQGQRLVNSFSGGDGPTGRLTSPEFKIERRYLSFLIGGGGYEKQTCINLLVDDKVVRSATGANTLSGGSEQLEPAAWDVHNLQGRTARLEIVDEASGGWGHINVDQIVFTDQRPTGLAKPARLELTAQKRFLLFPVRNGGPKRNVTVSANGKIQRRFEIELADDEVDWWAPLDISAWHGEQLRVDAGRLPEQSRAMAKIKQSDEAVDSKQLYHEELRSQLHFSPRRGWNNDPNGLVFYEGRYHLFFQHNPYGWSWGNMHWGHAVGGDLVHWRETGEALYPDRFGPMFSGSAVVDWHNTSGLGREGKPPLVLFYTAAGSPTVQCLAYSNDGGQSFTKYEGNPIVEQITPGNRDPKVIWHEASRRWVMTLYVELPEKKQTIHFFTSSDLIHWTPTSHIEGFFECPDLFELALDRDSSRKKWVLTAASSEYQVGSFDGERFVPETPKLPGHRGRGFYAAQTFSDVPAEDGRRVQIGWLQAPSPGMPFNQCMSLPLKLDLVATTEGPRLAWSPVKEFNELRGRSRRSADVVLTAGKPHLFEEPQSELLDISTVLAPMGAKEIEFDVRGVPVVYDVGRQELSVNGHRAAAPLADGKLDLRIVTDRTAFEIFACGGQVYLPMPVIPKADQRSVAITAKGGDARLSACDVWELRSIWP